MFDTFGTVVDWRSSLIAELTAFGRERDINADWTALVDAWRAAYHPSMDRVRKGEQPWTTLDGLHRASLDKLVAEFGIKGLTEADLQHINRGWHRLKPWPDSVPGLTRLKRKFIIGPLSNGNVSLLLNMGKERRHSVGHDLRLGPVRSLQAGSGDVSRGGEAAGHRAGAVDDGGGAQQRSGECAQVRADDRRSSRGRRSTGRTRSATMPPNRNGTWWRRTSRIWRRSWGDFAREVMVSLRSTHPTLPRRRQRRMG